MGIRKSGEWLSLLLGVLSLCCHSSWAFQSQIYFGFPVHSGLHCLAPAKGETETEPLSNVAWLQNRFNLTDEWAEKPAARHPGIHTLDQSEMIRRIDWLQKRLKLKDNECGKIIHRHLKILTLRPDTNLEPTLIFLQENLGLNGKELPRLVQKNPSILSLGTGKNQSLQRNINWIQKRLYLSKPKKIGKLVLKLPALLCLNATDNLDPTLSLLQERLDLNKTQVAKVCQKAPSILGSNYTTGIEPKLDWFHSRLNLNQIELGKMIRKAPNLLYYNVEDNLEPTLIWLQERLRLDDEAVRKIILLQPTILASSPSTKLEPCLKWLLENLQLEDDQSLARVIVAKPTLLGYRISTNLEPTLNFYKMSLGEEGAVRLLREQPIYFSFGLKTRLMPRWEQAQQHGIKLDIKGVKAMAAYRDHYWQAYVARNSQIATR